jgi:SAM-dependent methyltransferase
MPMDVPTTVRAALADQPIQGAVCLEAGAGVGNTTVGLLRAGATWVYAVTNDQTHAEMVRDRVGRDHPNRTAVLGADARLIPLPDESVDVITAHALFNVLPPADVGAVVAEFGRIASSGCRLVVDDYDPLPENAAVGELFSIENAASELADGSPALSFYPERMLCQQFVGAGWTLDRRMTLLEPVPWTEQHVRAHANATRNSLANVTDELASRLEHELDQVVNAVESESAGRMYSLAFQL